MVFKSVVPQTLWLQSRKTTNKDTVREHGCRETDTENGTYYSVLGTFAARISQQYYCFLLCFYILIYVAEPLNNNGTWCQDNYRNFSESLECEANSEQMARAERGCGETPHVKLKKRCAPAQHLSCQGTGVMPRLSPVVWNKAVDSKTKCDHLSRILRW